MLRHWEDVGGRCWEDVGKMLGRCWGRLTR